MSWNYRVMQFADKEGNPYWEVREVYYDEAGRPNGYSDCGASVMAAQDDEPLPPVESLRTQLQRMLECLEKPALTPGDCASEGGSRFAAS
jgi:hypothetical protein